MKKTDYFKIMVETYKPCFDLLRIYSCPTDCHFCCTNNYIYFGDIERKKILNKMNISSQIKKTKIYYINNIKLDEYRFTETPCPCLKNKCTIYDNRPFVCELYPISIDKALNDGYISIDPCPMGIDVMLDYTTFLMDNGQWSSKEFLYHLECVAKCIKLGKKFKTEKEVPIMDIPLEIIPYFNEYLSVTSFDYLTEKRKKWLNELQKNS